MLNDSQKKSDYDTYGDVEGLELEMAEMFKDFFDAFAKLPKQKKGPRKKQRRVVTGGGGAAFSKMFKDFASVLGLQDTDSFEEYDAKIKQDKMENGEVVVDSDEEEENDDDYINMFFGMPGSSAKAKKNTDDDEWEDVDDEED